MGGKCGTDVGEMCEDGWIRTDKERRARPYVYSLSLQHDYGRDLCIIIQRRTHFQ